jgi:hypothetical protein
MFPIPDVARRPIDSTAIIAVHGRQYRLTVRDRCPLPSICDIPTREFKHIFGRKGMRRGKVPIRCLILKIRKKQ